MSSFKIGWIIYVIVFRLNGFLYCDFSICLFGVHRLKATSGVNRVTLKKNKILFVISKPDVFKSPTSDTFVIFGEAKIEDLSAAAHTAAAEQLKKAELASANAAPVEATPAIEEQDDDEGEVDETGLQSKDIELIMTQADVKRSKAVKALREHNGEVVDAIMALTM